MMKKPDIGALLNPKSVAVIGAAPKGQGLSGRILEFMKLHPFAGAIYPVSRSNAEVQGLKAYPTIADCPGPVDLAVMIIPAKFVAAELEACGKAGVKAAAIVSSGFAEEPGEAGARMQAELKQIAQRYNMAVTGPNSEGFASSMRRCCRPSVRVAGPSDIPLLPANRSNGRVALVAQSGGMGFSFFDRGRPKEMAFDYIVTTGNEAALEGLDIVEHLIDEGKTDAFLMMLEDVKSPETFRRVAEKALRAGKPLIVIEARQDRCRCAGRRLSYRGAGRFLRLVPGAGAAIWHHRRWSGRGDGRHRQWFSVLARAAAPGQADRDLHGLGRRRRVAFGYVHAIGARGSDAGCGNAGAARSTAAFLWHLAEPGRWDGAGDPADWLCRACRAACRQSR